MISELRLQYFRSYQDMVYTFGEGVTIIVGPNASGKTNLLEAVLVVSRGGSYRVKDQELLAFNQDWARLDAQTSSGLRTVKITGNPPAKTFELSGKTYKRLQLPHTIPVVLFEPNHLSLLHGSPQNRRAYLDDLLEQTIPRYGALRRHYQRTLAQRNALLKRKQKPTNEELFPWNLRLSELGASMARARNALVLRLDEQLEPQYRALSSTETELKIQYQLQFPDATYETSLLQQLESNLPLDTLRGFTGAGPHREDFVLYFGDRPAEETASRGEIRTAVLALKTIELELLEQTRDMKPILLLDDVFSELDGSRRLALTRHLQTFQTFITTTDADTVKDNIPAGSSIITLG